MTDTSEAALWTDQGPISQGKIITAMLQGREEDAYRMIRGWSYDDLRILERAASKIAALADRERRHRR